MRLSSALKEDFSHNARVRGEEYYARGSVRDLSGSDTSVSAHVQGSRIYSVKVEWLGDLLQATCECPHYTSGNTCKHIWATVLAAESAGYLTGVPEFDLMIDIDTPEWDDLAALSDLSIAPRAAPRPAPLPRIPEWRDEIARIVEGSRGKVGMPVWPERRELLYMVSAPASVAAGGLVIELATRDRRVAGGYSAPNTVTLTRERIPSLPQADREIVSALAGGAQYYGWGHGRSEIERTLLVSELLARNLLPMAVGTGRCFLQTSRSWDNTVPLSWDHGEPWQFSLEIRARNERWAVHGILRRGTELLDVSDLTLAIPGFAFTADRVAPLAPDTRFEWLSYLASDARKLEAPQHNEDELLSLLLTSPGVPPVKLPEDLRHSESSVTPKPSLRIRSKDISWQGAPKLRAQLSFDYQGKEFAADDPARGNYDPETRHFTRRDFETEKKAAELLRELGLRYQPANPSSSQSIWELASTRLPRVVRALVDAGWHIDAEGKTFRRPGKVRIGVSSGVDWFELQGGVKFGESEVPLPALLEALRRGQNMVRLDDGTYGMLPEDWLRRIAPVAGAGVVEEGSLRFRRSQAGLLDALLATQPDAAWDETFERFREELRRFEGVSPAEQPAGFVGALRDYQRDGLGWMEFLRRFSFGGCLADDMGVGKTAQVLAMLETRRAARAAGEPVNPSLVVVPRSLVFNWIEEAKRFTPMLRVLDYTGIDRRGDALADSDVILTTYGTLRRDALRLRDVEFDYIVLDEAQAIKNSNTESAKAARLLRGQNRLVLSGTPVENHLGELWSLFEFLNPGMLGAATVFKLGGAERNPDPETRQLLARALRPFILRRTKEQVARELPPKTEQTIYCEMEPSQRKLYDQLRQHYRNTLIKKIEANGLAKSKIQVLEALLRLRQAACHPGLIDETRSGEGSAKLDVLLEQLREVLDEGHKALVFSQFTSLLRIVRQRLDAENIVYEYLDGSTQNRQAHVERFQNDPGCPLFLISLKAGGLGLNLTAAEYVFLLDPWWNPAVEAQAVDRAHRIGQERQVFAYRLIARDTVEEKVLELQKAKRDLADAILGEDNSLIRNLGREDLELLLS